MLGTVCLLVVAWSALPVTLHPGRGGSMIPAEPPAWADVRREQGKHFLDEGSITGQALAWYA